MKKNLTYIGLGGNSNNTYYLFNQALHQMSSLALAAPVCSRFYRTAPISPIPQPDYINAVCSFETTYSPHQLLYALQSIETKLGKVPKPKEAERPIDLDILFYGNKTIFEPELQIPHPRWSERLFVLIPLNELISEIKIGLQLIPLMPLIEKLNLQKVEVLA